jgi:magnesium transporter
MVTIVRYTREQGLESIQPSQLKACLKNRDDVIWVDVFEESANEGFDILTGTFHFHPLAIEDSFKYVIEDKVHLPKVDDYDSYLFIVFNGICNLKGIRYSLFPLSIFIGHNYLVIIHKNKEMAELMQKLNQEHKKNIFKRGPDFIVHIILDNIVDRYYPVLDNIEAEIDMLESQIFKKQPDNRSLLRILNFKRELIKLRRIASYQKEILFRLTRGDFDMISQEESVYYRNVYDHLVRVTDTVESYRDLISGMLDSYLSIVNNKMNEIIKFLTIISTIILPLTLVAGFFGMNFSFESIGLSDENGLLWTSVIMVIIIIIMLIYFKKRGWFDPRKDI